MKDLLKKRVKNVKNYSLKKVVQNGCLSVEIFDNCGMERKMWTLDLSPKIIKTARVY